LRQRLPAQTRRPAEHFFSKKSSTPVANVPLPHSHTITAPAPEHRPHPRARIEMTLPRISRANSVSIGYPICRAVVSTSRTPCPSLVGLWVQRKSRTNVHHFQGRYLNPSTHQVLSNGRMIGKQYDDDRNTFPSAVSSFLDAMPALHRQRRRLFTAAEKSLNVKYAPPPHQVTKLGLPSQPSSCV